MIFADWKWMNEWVNKKRFFSAFHFSYFLKECIATEEPKQKRKLAYSMDVDNIPECILLHAVNNKKHPYKLMFKQTVCSSDDQRSSLPVDILIEYS